MPLSLSLSLHSHGVFHAQEAKEESRRREEYRLTRTSPPSPSTPSCRGFKEPRQWYWSVGSKVSFSRYIERGSYLSICFIIIIDSFALLFWSRAPPMDTGFLFIILFLLSSFFFI